MRIIAAAVGFLLGNIVIGGLIWFFFSISTVQWETTIPFRLAAGLIAGAICFTMGEKILYPVLESIEKIKRKKE